MTLCPSSGDPGGTQPQFPSKCHCSPSEADVTFTSAGLLSQLGRVCWSQGVSLFSSYSSTQGRAGRDEGGACWGAERGVLFTAACLQDRPLYVSFLPTFPFLFSRGSLSLFHSLFPPIPVAGPSCSGACTVFPEPCQFAFPSPKCSRIGLSSSQCESFFFPPLMMLFLDPHLHKCTLTT